MQARNRPEIFWQT